ncbi:MAG: hypothetical protein ACRDQ2_12575, partial [Gaiellales bacterium]
VEAEVADLERRLSRQLLNLEADDPTPALRRRIATRVGELEDAIAERRQQLGSLADQAAEEPPAFADVAPLLSRLPHLADQLHNMPQRQLRALFDSLQLEVHYQPGEQAIDVALILYDGLEIAPAQESAEDWSVLLTGHYSNLPDLRFRGENS